MLSSAISYLFVPASRPERYGRALAAGADRVIIDLEDAVAPEDKDSSLKQLIAALSAGMDAPVHVRINADDSFLFERDLAALAALPEVARAGLSGVVLPKVEDPASVMRIRKLLGEEIELVALVESALGLSRVRSIARTPGLSRLALGAVDLSFDLDAEIASATIDHAYATLVLESRLAGLPAPIASPPLSIQDPEGIETGARRLRSLGLTAQLCIHPAQVEPIHAGFLPSDELLVWAQNVLTSDAGAAQIDGQMVDKPVRDRAKRILAQRNH
ncbi:HpcH/HpaI aldolase/citrate lyase family protein [Arthrobacter sp. NPDC058097]|uniref:HpcH/HpaI aldolase/citrate lyase family protein n=1 Tax=Arthrobacter sp. NPDC058097 TaxID=3346340 RepID=UPI0036D80B10